MLGGSFLVLVVQISINVFHYLEEGDLCNREIHLPIYYFGKQQLNYTILLHKIFHTESLYYCTKPFSFL